VNPELCVGAVAVRDESLLLIRRGHGPAEGKWSLPGGRVEGGELLAHAVVREVEEETSLEVVCADMIGWVERFVEDRHLVILDFRVNVLDDRQPEAGSDAAEALWVPLHNVAELDLALGLAEFLHDHGIIATIV
jgi:8-oxo-dGTP diphosphatase